MFQKHFLGVVFSLVMLLAGCGQKGGLYLPSEKPQSQKSKLKQKIEQQKQKVAPTEEEKLMEQDALMP